MRLIFPRFGLLVSLVTGCGETSLSTTRERTNTTAGTGGGETAGAGQASGGGEEGGGAGSQGGVGGAGTSQAGNAGSAGALVCSEVLCGTDCVDVSSSQQHCGVCFQFCSGSCQQGKCYQWKQIRVGEGFGCVLSFQDELFCWGKKGLVGDGTDEDRVKPQKVISNVQEFSLADHACVLNKEGEIFCWGDNYLGCLGNGTYEKEVSPKKLDMVLSSKIEVATGFSCAISKGNDLFCWGNNSTVFLELATTTNQDFLLPTKIKISKKINMVNIALATISVKDLEGSFFTWGQNQDGMAAVGSMDSFVFEPTQIQLNKKIEKITYGSLHVCFLFEDGSVSCAGSNKEGQVRNDDQPSYPSPIPIEGLPPVVDVNSAGSTSCALTADGDVFCWGQDPFDSSGTSKKELNKVEGLPKAAQISSAFKTSCILSVDNEVYCWGDAWGGALNGPQTLDDTPPIKLSW